MLMNMPGGDATIAFNLCPARVTRIPSIEMCVVRGVVVAVAGVLVRLVVVATGHLSPATARCQCGHQCDQQTGVRGPESRHSVQCMARTADPDNVGCAVVPWW